MSNTNIEQLYDYVLQQMAAESYFEGIPLTSYELTKNALTLGANREDHFDQDSSLTESRL